MAKRISGLESVLRDLNGDVISQTDQMGFPILDDEDKPKTATAKVLLSSVLGRASTADPIRAIDVALKIRGSKSQHIELDDEDVTMLTTIVKADRASNLTRAFLLRLLEDAKPVGEKR